VVVGIPTTHPHPCGCGLRGLPPSYRWLVRDSHVTEVIAVSHAKVLCNPLHAKDHLAPLTQSLPARVGPGTTPPPPLHDGCNLYVRVGSPATHHNTKEAALLPLRDESPSWTTSMRVAGRAWLLENSTAHCKDDFFSM
jgi:hypothetical protein